MLIALSCDLWQEKTSDWLTRKPASLTLAGSLKTVWAGWMTTLAKYRFNLDRRSGRDRRGPGHKVAWKQLFNGKRTAFRRRSDGNRLVFFDRYSPNLFAFVAGILFFSVLDAILTVLLINHGAAELNPLMAFYLTISPHTFLAVKYSLTCASVFLLLIVGSVMMKSRILQIQSIFSLILAMFAAVVVWELYLLVRVVI
jgi:hypothetical protein